MASNMAQLEKQILGRMQKMMQVASDKMLGDMYDETEGFYTGGEPKMYERTGALGDTPRVTSVRKNGNTLEFDAYLDQSGGYTTGKNPTMKDVLNLANYGNTNSSVGKLREAKGTPGFWERAEAKMEKTFKDTFNKI